MYNPFKSNRTISQQKIGIYYKHVIPPGLKSFKSINNNYVHIILQWASDSVYRLRRSQIFIENESNTIIRPRPGSNVNAMIIFYNHVIPPGLKIS